MSSLGASLIVKNESTCIRDCLESIRGLDEIVIVDTGSEDNTVEICREYTDRIYTDYKWRDNFAEARNVSLLRCTADFILIIDADEVLTCSIKNIRQSLKHITGQRLGMTLKVETAGEIFDSIRIIKRDPRIYWSGAIHNRLMIKDIPKPPMMLCYRSNFKIVSGDSPAHKLDPDRTLRILNAQLKIDPDNTRYLFYLGREYLNRVIKYRDNAFLDPAINTLKRFESLAFSKEWGFMLAEGLFYLGICLLEKGEFYGGIETLAKSILVLPSYEAPARLLSKAMLKFPNGVKYQRGAEFWKKIADGASNEDVEVIIRKPHS